MFSRENRLGRSHDILTVLRHGTRKSNGPLTCYFQETPKVPAQVAVIVDKKVSKLAIKRNLVKRRIRAALREIGLPEARLVVRAYQGSADLPYVTIHSNLTTCLRAVTRSR